MARQDHVVVQKLNGRSHANGFLAPASVDAANDFPLAVKDLFNSRFGLASEFQVIEHPLQSLSIGGRGHLSAFGGPGLSHISSVE